MDLFEYQAKELFAKHGVAVPRGRVAWSPPDAEAAAAELGGTVVVKAQVQTGGRGAGRHGGGEGTGPDGRARQGGRHQAGP